MLLKKNTSKIRKRSGFIQFFFNKIDRASIVMRNQTLILAQFFNELRTFINELSYLVIGWARNIFSLIFSAFIYSNPQHSLLTKLILFSFKFIFGLPILLLAFCIMGSIVLIFGTLAGILGLRNLGDYSLTEQTAAWAVAIAFGFTFPIFASSYLLFKICLICIFSILIVGLNFLYGQCGIVSLSHAAFVLVGAYLTTLFYNGAFGFAFPYMVSVLLASLMAGVLGMVLGGPSLRIKDEYLIIITLAFAIAVPQVLRSHYLATFGGGSVEGIEINPILPPAILKWMAPTVWGYYVIVVSFVVLIGFAYNIQLKSQVGRAFALIKCDDSIARSQGVNVTQYKLLAFVMSAFYAAFAGGLTTIISPFVSSQSYASADSIDYFIGLVIGGSGSLFGSVIGGAFLAWDQDIIKAVAKIVYGGQNLMRVFYGIILVVMVNFFPEGIGGLLQRGIRKMVTPVKRRGLYFMRPPPDYDFLAAKDVHDVLEGDKYNEP